MARPRSYDRQAVITAAMEAFWAGGFGATGIHDLEEATGLGRSSLYLAFGSKQALFHNAVADYEERFLGTLLAAVEGPAAGLSEAAGFFAALAARFRDPAARRGCLVVNAITELAQRDAQFTPLAVRLVNRYHTAFSHALRGAVGRGEMQRGLQDRRARMLASSAHGVWVQVRADADGAATSCRAIAREITSWAGNGSAPRPKAANATARGRTQAPRSATVSKP